MSAIAPITKSETLTLPRADLANAIAAVVSVVPGRVEAPILGSVLLRDNGDGNVEAIATDLDMQITARLPVPGRNAGDFVLPDARRMTKAVKALRGDNVTLTRAAAIDDKTTSTGIAAGDVSLSFSHRLHVDDFPFVQTIGDPFATATLAGQFAKRGCANDWDMVAIWKAVDELLGADPTLQHSIDPDAPCHICVQNGAVVEIVSLDEDGNARLQTLQGQKWPSGDRAQWWFAADGTFCGGYRDWTVRPGTQAELDAARRGA